MAGRFRPLEWLWLGSERNRAREIVSFSPRVAELARRAELSMELGERALRPAEPLVHGDGDAHACDLYAQAIYWALAAQAKTEGDAPGAFSETSPPSLETVWLRADPELLVRSAGSPEALERIRSSIVNKSFADFGELERAQRVDLAARLAAFASELMNPLRSERKRLARIWTLRLVRVGGLLFVLLALFIATLKLLAWNDERRDLARRATWTLSSTANVGGCQSPAQVCAESPNYFFHSLVENDSWVMFDLGRERGFSRVTVENRLDCCPERAKPLIVEVSNDRKKWKQVARHDEDFTTWRAEFSRTRARWVRVRRPGNGILHLSRVKILP